MLLSILTKMYEGFNFKTHKGVIEKYSNDIILTFKESIKSVYDKLKEEEAENAE